MNNREDIHRCKICGHTNRSSHYVAREMMFGFRDEFDYVECGQCGCLQIKNFPSNIEKYYPTTYWNAESSESLRQKSSKIKRFFRRQVTKQQLGTYSSSANKILKFIGKKQSITPVFSGWDWIKHFKALEISIDASILDVGCGSGDFLSFLHNRGFSRLRGVDNGIHSSFDNGLWKIHKGDISEISGSFDVITMHHSLEHMSEQEAVLKNAYRLLKPHKHLVVRIPVLAEAWRRYGVDWVQLDPPRHFFLHTINSISLLSESVGFNIANIEFDSNEFQFWGSEQYRQDIPLLSAHSHLKNSAQSVFTAEDINKFKQQAVKLNAEGVGDQACLYLKKR